MTNAPILSYLAENQNQRCSRTCAWMCCCLWPSYTKLKLLKAAASATCCNSNVEALVIAYTISGVPWYNYSIMGPQNLLQIIQAPVVVENRSQRRSIFHP